MLGRPRKVFAKTRTASVNIEAEDTGAAIVTFESGVIGVLEATTAIRPKDAEASFSLIGRNGFRRNLGNRCQHGSNVAIH